MDFPERVSQEDYERYCGRSLRLFLSVDIVNSTALKQEFREREVPPFTGTVSMRV